MSWACEKAISWNLPYPLLPTPHVKGCYIEMQHVKRGSIHDNFMRVHSYHNKTHYLGLQAVIVTWECDEAMFGNLPHPWLINPHMCGISIELQHMKRGSIHIKSLRAHFNHEDTFVLGLSAWTAELACGKTRILRTR